jgi:hypothetical protein
MAESASDRIDRILTESPIGLSAAAKLFGTFRSGRPTSPVTVYRWCVEGIKLPDGRRIHLEHIRIGSRLMTSRAACVRFLEGQQTDATDRSPQTPPRTAAQRARASEAAGKKLERAGW